MKKRRKEGVVRKTRKVRKLREKNKRKRRWSSNNQKILNAKIRNNKIYNNHFFLLLNMLLMKECQFKPFGCLFSIIREM